MLISLNKDVCRIHYYNEIMVVVLNDSRQIFVKDFHIQYILEKICQNGFFDTKEFLVQFEMQADVRTVEKIFKTKIETGYLHEIFMIGNEGRCVLLTGIKGKRIPLKLQIEITRRCNLNCSHCYKFANMDNDILMYNQIEDILNEVGRDLFEIGITGGEPLVHNDFIHITELIEKFAPVLSLNTNGLLLHTIPMKILKKYKNISISLYGTSNEEYLHVGKNPRAFEELQCGTRLLLENNIKFNISVLLDEHNHYRIEEYIKTAIALGACSIQFGTISNIGREKINEKREMNLDRERIREIYRIIRQFKNRYSNQINIIEWTRDWVLARNREIFQNTCFTCEAGSLQWVMTEKERFKPCVILPEEKELEFTKKLFCDYINGNYDIDWKEFYGKLKAYCNLECQKMEDFCDRIKNPSEKNEETN